MRKNSLVCVFIFPIACLSILAGQEAGRCGSIDRSSSLAVQQEVNRVFNETLDNMEITTPEGVKAATWMGWKSEDQARIKCLGSPAVPFVAEHLGSVRPFGQLLAVRMLGWLGGREIVPPLASVLKNSKSETIKISALESLFAAPEADARPVLDDTLKSDANQRVRAKARQILARYDGPSTQKAQ